jgi:hypothetical protein
VAEFGRPGSRLSIPFPADVTSQVAAAPLRCFMALRCLEPGSLNTLLQRNV